MIWNFLLSGESFADWINNLIPDPQVSPNARFNKGQALDPFETSLRVTKRYTENLIQIESGQTIKGQKYTDLTKARILNRVEGGYEISALGKSVLSKWRELGIDNDSDDDEFYRMLILICEAKKLHDPLYSEMIGFWKEIKKAGSSIQFITNPSSLYLISVLNQEINGFNPWRHIADNGLKVDPVNTIMQLNQEFQHKPEVISRIPRIESIWLTDFRPKGRQIFCLAMDCVVSTLSEAKANLESQEVDEFRGSFVPDSLKEVFASYETLNIGQNEELVAENRIFYGPPGTGKSTEARRRIRGAFSTTTTFHPATDYGTFVGYYKPQSRKNDSGDVDVFYGFQAQHFLNAYVSAWLNLADEQFLLIEEINRGNCAKIFGDIFQLLDRDEQGFSDYVISVDSDISEYLKSKLGTNKKYIEAIKSIVQVKNHYGICDDEVFNFMTLPNNLSIFATMNTSDQSLFPMDSAFKRRWNWTYIPIKDLKNNVCIEVGSDKYDWFDFVKKVNRKIALVTESEDKKIGTFFVKHRNNTVSLDEFVNKVLFYLWNDIYKEEFGSDPELNVFISEDDNSEIVNLFYSDLYKEEDINQDAVIKLLDANSVKKVS